MQLQAVKSSSFEDLRRTEMSQENKKSKRGVARTSSQLLQVIVTNATIPALELAEKDPWYVDLNHSGQIWETGNVRVVRLLRLGDASLVMMVCTL